MNPWRRLDAWADERHRSETIAASWHLGHAAVNLVAILANLGALAWHLAARRRHLRDATRKKEGDMHERRGLFVAVLVAVSGVPAWAAGPPVAGVSEPYWLALGGIVGAFARALFTRGQQNFGLETAQDVFLGAAIGLLWNVPLFGVWPPFELTPSASVVQRAAIVAVVVAIGVAVIKRVLVKVVPAYMERLAGKLGGDQPPKT